MKKGFTISMLVLSLYSAGQHNLSRLKVSDNHRFFITEGGKPFFWLGDTGWLLFARCNREEALHYLDNRQQQGFNVIQVMLLHEMNIKNVYGDHALLNGDASSPLVTPGNDFKDEKAYDFWDHVDFITDEAAKRGIYMAMVPVWGGNVKDGKVTVQQAETYARFLAGRYKDNPNIIWLDGGDIPGNEGLEVWKTIGRTLKKYDPGHLVTYHPRGRYSSSEWFHAESWLDFNMFQSGHRNYAQDTSRSEKNHFGEDNWRYVEADYNRQPVKPTMDGEPSYEKIPQGLHDSLQPRWTDADLRRYAYWSVFAGGAGFTYGDNAVMQFYIIGMEGGSFGVRENWQDELSAPGATQMHYLKDLMLRHNYLSRVPAQELIAGENLSRYEYIAATKGKGYALLYTYTGRTFRVDLSKLGFRPRKANWFHPADGKIIPVTKFARKGKAAFDPPGEPVNGNDWVLVLEGT